MSPPGLYAHTDYGREAGGLTRLDAIVAVLERLTGGAAKVRAATRVLDCGCGTGNLAAPIASLGYPITGIDVDQPSVLAARTRCPLPHARFSVSGPDELNPGSFEVAIASEVLEHLSDPAAYLAGIHRALVPGGLLVATVPNGYGPWEMMNRAKRLVARLGLGSALRSFQRLMGYRGQTLQSLNPHLEHVQFFTHVRFASLAESSGFRLARSENLTFLVTVFPVSWVFRRVPSIERLDARAARRLPAAAASGWLFELVRGE